MWVSAIVLFPVYEVPPTPPNGQPWPANASYIPEYPYLAIGGLSSVTVDNTQNSSDEFVKLVSLDFAPAFPVRVCYIPAFAKFQLEKLISGRYDVRYRDLSSGAYFKSEEFRLTESKTYQSTKFSNISLTLYKVANGNMETEPIDESQF